jgi:predicted ATP-binding protein involved in virulence
MKIRKVKWKNHSVLGNLELDFINYITNQPFETIILAGENGTGKTTILKTISDFLNLGSFEYFDYIEYNIGADIYKAVPTSDGTTHKNFYDTIDTAGTSKRIRTDRGNNPQIIETDITDMRHYGCVFSKARADYKTQQIRSTTTKSIDADKYDNDQEDDFTSLKQLLVDIHNQDNSEYAELNKALNSNPKSWIDYYPLSKTYRFKNAFDQFFDKLKYDKVIDSNDEKTILFNKNEKSVSIDNLSTGEKQIVFRGSYLLKNNKKLLGASIMIDEPELSMHPKWQKRILNYYKNLFTDNSQQNVQLFLATHSEYVVEDALSDKIKNLVIVLNEVNGIIETNKIIGPSVLPTITCAETNYLAFDIVSTDYHIELYGWLQTKNSNYTVKSCDDFIKRHSAYKSLDHGKASSFNTTTYDTLTTYIRNAIDHPDPNKTYTEIELRTSTQLLIELCK